MKDFQTGLTVDEVRRRFRYVKSTGVVTRRVPVYGGPFGTSIQDPVGSVVGTVHKDGYRYTSVNGRIYSLHRLIWLMVTGAWPECEIDHWNGVRHDNRWKNLRHATTTQNRQNTLGQKSRTNPYPGVYEPAARPGVHCAQIKVNGRVIYLGAYASPEAGYLARCMAEHLYFGEFAGSKRP